MSGLFVHPPPHPCSLRFFVSREMHRSDFMLLTLCSYTVAMCGDGANDCGVSAGHLQFACHYSSGWKCTDCEMKKIWNLADHSFLLAGSFFFLCCSGFEESAQRDLSVRAGGLRGVTLHLHHSKHLLCPQTYQVSRQLNEFGEDWTLNMEY